jgi:hypothetical protein
MHLELNIKCRGKKNRREGTCSWNHQKREGKEEEGKKKKKATEPTRRTESKERKQRRQINPDKK